MSLPQAPLGLLVSQTGLHAAISTRPSFKNKWHCLLAPFSQGMHLKLSPAQREREGKIRLSLKVKVELTYLRLSFPASQAGSSCQSI